MKKRSLKKYDITQCALYKCRTKKRLAFLLLLDLKELDHISGIIRYHSFEIDKKDSEEKRKITAPNKNLKKVQRRILFLLQRVIRPDWLISGEKGKCYIDNGKAHVNGQYVLTIDIRKFYDHCVREAVYQFFIQKMKTTPDVAKLLTDISTYNMGIPTGCPTSQLIAFYAYTDMFSEIADIAKENGCVFTLYVDDMTFSSDKPISTAMLIRKIDCTLRKYNHKPKYSKIKYYHPSDYKSITGTVISPKHKLLTPNVLQHKIYTGFIRLKPKLIDGNETLSEEEGKELSTLTGRIQSSCNIEDGKYPEMKRIIKNSQAVARFKEKTKGQSRVARSKQE